MSEYERFALVVRLVEEKNSGRGFIDEMRGFLDAGKVNNDFVDSMSRIFCVNPTNDPQDKELVKQFREQIRPPETAQVNVGTEPSEEVQAAAEVALQPDESTQAAATSSEPARPGSVHTEAGVVRGEETAGIERTPEDFVEPELTDEQIAKFFEDLTKTNFARFYSQAMALFNEEDMKAIEAAPNDEEANKKIREIYKLKTGRDPEEEMQKFMDDFAKGFLEEHAKNTQAA